MGRETDTTLADDLVTVVGRRSEGGVGVAPEPGAMVGRYFVIDEIGRGAAGVVLRAYDPKLQREVALKMVRTDALTPENEARVIREARAMALLNHPNVVHIYDVDIDRDRVILAMELVEGTTLRDYIAKHRPDWRTALELYVAAGHGLAAAHAKGLLHRDFKPANVLVGNADVGSQCRVQVTDFGLARMQTGRISVSRESIDPERSMEVAGDADAPIDDELTEMGAVMGTLAYMPPEQHGGKELTAAADQYAFCVAVWEGLSGRRPFGGDTARELFKSKMAGSPTWPRGTKVPAKVIEAIRRGLSVNPAHRWSSMTALLDAMTEQPSRRIGWVLGAGVGTLVLGAVAYAATDERESPCAAGAQRLEPAWSPQRRAAVQAAFDASKAPYAAKVGSHVRARLDEYAAEWIEHYTQICEATLVRHEQSSALMDEQMACLRRAQRELDTMGGLLTEAEADLVDAPSMLDALPSLEECRDVKVSKLAPPKAEHVDDVERLRGQLAEIRALRKGGKGERAREQIEALVVAAAEIDYAPLTNEVELERGHVLKMTGHYEDGRRSYETALARALAMEQFDIAFSAANELVLLTGDRMGYPSLAEAYVVTAQGLVEHQNDEMAQSHLDFNIAGNLHAQGRYRDAEATMLKVVEAYERAFGSDSPRVTAAKTNLALLQFQLGHYAEAEEAARRMLARRIEEYGGAHPMTARAHNLLGGALQAQGRYDEAIEQTRAGLEAMRASVGRGNAEEARMLGNVGILLTSAERYEEAEPILKEALELRTALQGAHSSEVASNRLNLATLYSETERLDEAEKEARAAVRLLEAVHPQGHPRVDNARMMLGEVLRERGELEAAIELFELAWERIEADPNASADDRARAMYLLGEALAAKDGKSERARELVVRAREEVLPHADIKPQLLETIETWLEEHPEAG